MQQNNIMKEAERMLTICNACRYCEGYCAVFPALEKRHIFETGDIHYLANLCHNCSECYYACQYADPHEFKVNIPKILATVRNDSYVHYAWPPHFAKFFHYNAYLVSGLSVVLTSFFLLMASYLSGASIFSPIAGGDFYQLIPHNVLIRVFGAASLFALFAMIMSFIIFWRSTGEKISTFLNPFALWQALKDVLQLKYLHNSGYGCTYPDETHSMARKWFHHLTFYGFMLCFAATVLGTIYHYLFGLVAPYPLLSLPVIFGTVGGVGLIIGPVGLWYLKNKGDVAIVDQTKRQMEITFIALLIVISVTGLLLLALRETHFLGVMFALHLGTVLTFFIMLPYCKFIHGLYRGGALVKYALENQREKKKVF